MNDIEYLQEYGKKLPESVKKSKWVASPEEHEDRPGQSLATRNHEVIRQWAEERRGLPAKIPGTEYDGHPSILRFSLPGYEIKNLKETSWEDWFKTFDEERLLFIFQEHLKQGNLSNFFRIESPFQQKKESSS